EDGALGELGQAAAAQPAALGIHEAGGALAIELPLPVVQGVLGDADQGGEVSGGQAAALPGVQKEQSLLRGHGRGGSVGLLDQAASMFAATGQLRDVAHE